MISETRGAVPSMIAGREEASLDDKGRVMFSRKKRDALGERVSLAIGFDGVLCAYPQWVWDAWTMEIRSAPISGWGRSRFTRHFYENSEVDMTFDNQGRLTIPTKYRERCNLSGKILLVGAGDRVEIWSPVEREKYDQDPDGFNREWREFIVGAYNEMLAEARAGVGRA